MPCPRLIAILLLCAVSSLAAQDYGDATLGYCPMLPTGGRGPSAGGSAPERLGTLWSKDSSNPVTPAWTGDNDDGVSVMPTWQAGSSANSVSVFVSVGPVSFPEYLAMFLDLNDDGDFNDAGEMFSYPTVITTDGNYSFNNIAIPDRVYLFNGTNKIAARFILRYYSPVVGPSDVFAYGEIEDYLFDVLPSGLYIATPSPLPVGVSGASYAPVDIMAANGTAPYQWSVTFGSIPAGMGLAPAANGGYRLSGTPTVAGSFQFNVQVLDATSATFQRQYQIQVMPPATAIPFFDDFSTDKGWILGTASGVAWQRGPCGSPYLPPHGLPEPLQDFSQGADNFILGDNIGATYPDSILSAVFATSPAVNCSGVQNVELRFRRWLNVEQPQYDRATIDVTGNNGFSWTRVWQNQSEVTDNGWVEVRIDISQWAGNQPGVRVRFGIGPTDSSYQYAGWCLDDLEIREKPATDRVVATGFRIISPHALGSQADPQVFTGTQTPFEITLNNLTAEDQHITQLAVGVAEYGGGPPQVIGQFQLSGSMPLVVPANVAGFVATGTLDCTVTALSGPNVTLRAVALLTGIEPSSGKPIEAQAEEIFYVDNGPPPLPPMMEVREWNFSGVVIESGVSPTGTARDFGSRDIDGGGTGWLNIVILNGLSSPITVGRPSLAGPDAAHFRLDTSQWTQPDMQLATSGAGSQIFFSVRFDPHDLGPRNAWVSFVHDASFPTTSPYVVELAGVGTGNPPELEVREVAYTGPKVVPGAPAAGSQRDLGHVAVTNSSHWLNLVLWNRFTTDTTIAPLPTLTGPDAADFVLSTGNLAPTIPGTSSFTGLTYFSVRFAPQSAGLKTALVTFGHNASSPAGGLISVEVTGLGVTTPGTPLIGVAEAIAGSPTYAVTNGSAPQFGREMGHAVVGSLPANWLEIRIVNTGNGFVTLGMPVVGGQDGAHFTIDTSNFFPGLNPGQSSSFLLAFTPLAIGPRLASIAFTHNAAGQTASPFLFEISGLCVPNSPLISVYEDSIGGPMIAPGAPALGTGRDFGSRDVGTGASSPRVIVVTNTGSQDLNLGTPTLIGADAGHFELNLSSFNAVVAPGTSTSFRVAFRPQGYGSRVALIGFSHDDPTKAAPFLFEVAGFGDAPGIELHEGNAFGPTFEHDSPATGMREFGTHELTTLPTAWRTITVVNAGNATLTLATPTLTGLNSMSFHVETTGFPSSLAPGQSASFTVRFAAAQVGLKEAIVHIPHNDIGVSSPFAVRIQGKGTSPNGVRITTPPVLPRARIGNPYYWTELDATGGTPGYEWSLRPGSTLPSGLELKPWGRFDGTPNGVSGEYQFTVRVEDHTGGTDDVTFTLLIDPGAGSGFGKPRGKASGGCATQPANALLPVVLAAGLLAAVRRRRRA